MSSLIVFRRVAKRELDDAISWYEGRREGLGQEFSLAVEKQLARIASDPDHFAPVKGSIRRSILRRFPYSIFFLAEDSRIVVLAIFHAKRDPHQLEHRF